MWYWLKNKHLYNYLEHAIDQLIWDRAPITAEVASVSTVNSLPFSPEFPITDAWIARNPTERLKLAWMTVLIDAPVPIRTQLFKHKIGFCVSGDTEVTFYTDMAGSGGKETVTIRDLYNLRAETRVDSRNRRIYARNRKTLRVLNTDTGFFERGTLINVVKSGIKPLFEITTSAGKKLKLTKDHRIWTKDGWQSLEKAIGLDVTSNGLATMSKTVFVGVNGRLFGGYDTYRQYDWMKARRNEGLSVEQIAEAAECSYHTARKWLKVHGLQFDQTMNLTGKNGKPPWNKGKTGYALNYVMPDEQKAKLRAARSGEKSNFWKGGVFGDMDWRREIAQWTARQAKKCHQKHWFTCQNCEEHSKKLVAHHVIPVYADERLAYNFDNLATVCAACHSLIHKSPEAEKEFAQMYLKQESVKGEFRERLRPATVQRKKLHAHFEEIIDVRYVGEEEVYDLTTDHPSHNFVANGIIVHNCENEVSRRYVDAQPHYFMPEMWRARAPNAKQGSLKTPIKWPILANLVAKSLYFWSDVSYRALLRLNVCPEQARFLLPQGMMTQWYWTGSLDAFVRAINLRTAEHAQEESWKIMQNIKQLIKIHWPLTYQKTFGP